MRLVPTVEILSTGGLGGTAITSTLEAPAMTEPPWKLLLKSQSRPEWCWYSEYVTLDLVNMPRCHTKPANTGEKNKNRKQGQSKCSIATLERGTDKERSVLE